MWLIDFFCSIKACETQLKLLPVGLENLNLIPEEARKAIYDASRRPPEGYEAKTHKQDGDNKDGPRQQVNELNSMIFVNMFLTIHFDRLLQNGG